jgi:hypothetical protein
LKRGIVGSLVNGISGNCHKSYRTLNEARVAYIEAVAVARVRVVKNSGESVAIFGPVETAMHEGMEE